MLVSNLTISHTRIKILAELCLADNGVNPSICKPQLTRLTLCYFVLVFLSLFSIAITSLGEARANFSAFLTFVQFVLVWFCRFSLSLGVWEGLLLGLWHSLDFSLTFFFLFLFKVLLFCYLLVV